MPRLHGIREIRFVSHDWTSDPRGYPHEVVTDPIVYEHYKEHFERALIKAHDRIRLCAEVGHDSEHGGCGAPREDGTRMCEFWLRMIQQDCYASERTKLVRITISV